MSNRLWVGFRTALVLAILLAPFQATLPAHAQASTTGSTVMSGSCEGGILPLAVVAPAGGLAAGCAQRYVLKVAAGIAARGTFGFVDLPPCPDSPCAAHGRDDRLECELTYGNLCCVGPKLIGRELALRPGSHTGPFLRAFLTRWNADTDHRIGVCYADYKGNTRRIVRVVVLEPFVAAGRASVRVAGFADFFLRNLPLKAGDSLEGEFLPAPEP